MCMLSRLYPRTIALILACVVFSFVGLSGSSYADTPRDPMIHFFQQGFANLPEELAAARAERKLGIFVMFDDADCPWCARMKATVLNQPVVQDYFRQHFRVLEVDKNGDVPITDFSGREMSQKDFAFKLHRVRATPVFVFFDTQGNVMYRYTGAAKDVGEFLLLGSFVVEGHYKTTNFTAYKRDKLAARKNKS